MRSETYSAEDIFSIRLCEQIVRNPGWTNLRIESNKSLEQDRVRGAGLYAIHYEHRLVYIGQFRGTKSNPFGGDVCATRWAKHLGTLTLRDRRISFGLRAIDDMQNLQRANGPLADTVHAREWPTISSHRGRVSSLNRALFAEEFWEIFSRISDASGLTGFKISYVQLDPGLQQSHEFIRAAIEAAEEIAIRQLRPRCNAKIPAGTSHDADIQTVIGILIAALERTVNGDLRPADGHAPHLEVDQMDPQMVRPDALHYSEPQDEQNDDIDTATAEEAFLERLADNQDARIAIDQLIDAFCGVADAYVWHTMTNEGDLRIRSTRGRRRFSNVARIYWQRKLNRFNSELNLTAEKCLELGATTAVPNHAGKALPTRATFDMPVATDGLIACLLEAASHQP